jgi:hypothetical protein
VIQRISLADRDHRIPADRQVRAPAPSDTQSQAEENHGILAKRRSTRANPTAEVRQRQFCATVELVGAARALGDAAGSGRGQGHRGAPPGAPGQTLTDRLL